MAGLRPPLVSEGSMALLNRPAPLEEVAQLALTAS
jgi:hypothetical protein